MLFFIISILAVIAFLDLRAYYKSSYYEITHASPLSVRFDAGRLGEYLIWKNLRDAEKQGAKFLFNVYIPKCNGETSEIDVLMICSKGIFVFESKNYSGWIFGGTHYQYWIQTLPAGRGKSHKSKFFNPILQNRGHIQHLSKLIGDFPMYSIICFSERCTLKSVPDSWADVKIIKRNEVRRTVSEICQSIPETFLETEEIDELFAKLYPYTQVSDAEKAAHIQKIQAKHKK